MSIGRLRSNSRFEEIAEEEETLAPSAPPLTSAEAAEAEEDEEGRPLLTSQVSIEVTEDDLRDFEAGMAVGTSERASSKGGTGEKTNCCASLLKDCLELIDAKASAVLKSEDLVSEGSLSCAVVAAAIVIAAAAGFLFDVVLRLCFI